MPSSLFNAFKPQNPFEGFVSKLNKFKEGFSGDPKQQVQQLLNSGKISQAQYNQAIQMANQIQQMMMKTR